MKKIMTLLFFVMCGAVWSSSALAQPGDAINYLQVQDGGRIKPYDSFAREMLEIVYGKAKYEGRAATEIVLTWMLSPQAWQGKKIFEVRNHQVLEALKLPKEERWFSGDEIFGNERFSLLRQELQAKRETKEKLDPYFQALQRLENQFFVFQEVAAGRMLKIAPPKEGDTWVAVADLDPALQEKFVALTKAFVSYIGAMAQ
ncbi:MAG: cytochrome C biogenesis protein, partial [Bdellovibrio sp.]|nr:cytochrome C biogenesis protein [Bdellovibrio sp.]